MAPSPPGCPPETETRIVHVATWAHDADVLDAALATCPEAATRISSLRAGRDSLGLLPPAAGVQVVLSLRSADQILGDAWFREVEAGGCTPYDRWLAAEEQRAGLPDSRPLVEELAGLRGASGVTVSAAADRHALLTGLERLAGLPLGRLTGSGPPAPRTLTVGEAEMLRTVNASFAAERWPEDVRRRYTESVVEALRRYGAAGDGGLPVLPDAVRVRLQDVHESTLALVSRTGVDVLGDLQALAPAAGETADAGLRPSTAARAVAAALVASGLTDHPDPDVAELARVDEASVRQVLDEIRARIRRPRRRRSR